MTDIVIVGIIIGVSGTLAMDLINHLFARRGIILKIDVAMIGRMVVGWARGRFRYRHPTDLEPVANERLLGYIAHYVIGIGLAMPFLFYYGYFAGGPVPESWALPYGVATTVASWFLVYPSMGLGMCGWRSPDGVKAILSPLANHFFYGAGLAASLTLLAYA
jgi:hypothetical protein